MKNSLLIHHDNVPCLDDFEDEIYFDIDDADVDSYISKEIIPKLANSLCKIVYIKDNLSENYMELYGIRVAYHIRFSEELGEKRYLPIVILSEIDGYLLGKLSDEANILFSKNIFVVKNDKNLLKFGDSFNFTNLTVDEYQSNFLNLIHLDAPSEYESHHDIANEWAIYRWSTTLGLKSEAIIKNYNHIEFLLYFKYLKTIQKSENINTIFEPKALQSKGNILYIDDEWGKGWSDILKKLFEPSDIEFETLKYNFKDTTKFKMLSELSNIIKEKMPDLVILDLRFTQSDHESKKDIDQYTGIKIAKLIKEINPGIQTIMMSATSQSLIVQKLYEYGVLGYVKKEHPKDMAIDTKESIDKLLSLSEKALQRKYLKEVWEMQQKILELSIFKNEEFYQIKAEINFIYNILDSDISNKFNFTMLAIYKILERIIDFYIDDRDKTFKDSRESIRVIYKVDGKYQAIDKGIFVAEYKQYGLKNEKHAKSYHNSVKNKFLAICFEKLSLISDTLYKQIEIISNKRNNYIHPKKGGKSPNKRDIIEWINMIEQILEKVHK